MLLDCKRPLSLVLAVTACLTMLFGYKAQNPETLLLSDDTVAVSKIKTGWLFDGAGEDDALIFYPGALVEPAAYAPLLRNIAAAGVDCFLVKMPMNLAVLSPNKAKRVMQDQTYDRWFFAGHSLGGAMAAQYASKHLDTPAGLFLLGAYTAKDLTLAAFPVVYVYGSEDGVLNRDRLEKGILMSPVDTLTIELEGGNHAQFGVYGQQKGDGKPTISPEAQQTAAANEILRVIRTAAQRQQAA